MDSELYSQLLQKDWLSLAKNIRRIHSVGEEKTGTFRITRGSGWLARQLARWSGLPSAADAAQIRLNIIPDTPGERWERMFDGLVLVTRQWKESDGSLVERFRDWELCFKLRVQEGNLFYHQSGARLCVGAWRIPMPRACAPRVDAKETADGGPHVFVSVTVALPFVGRLVSYEGLLNVKGEPA
jgi:hypothetical protein